MTDSIKNSWLLYEIAQAKRSYCEFATKNHEYYDIILPDPDYHNWKNPQIHPSKLSQAIKQEIVRRDPQNSVRLRIDRLNSNIKRNKKYQHDLRSWLTDGTPFPEFYSPSSIQKKIQELQDEIQFFQEQLKNPSIKDVTFRVMTYSHIPPSNIETTPQRISDLYIPVKFVPFKHYNHKGQEVGVSWPHQNIGKIPDLLPFFWNHMVNKFATAENWRGYSAIDDFKQNALMRLMEWGLKFHSADLKNEDITKNGIKKKLNAFSYLTATIENSFRGEVNTRKKEELLMDQILNEDELFPKFHYPDH